MVVDLAAAAATAAIAVFVVDFVFVLGFVAMVAFCDRPFRCCRGRFVMEVSYIC